MVKLIIGAAIGWAAIVWLAYSQIVSRSEAFCYSNRDCMARYAAQRREMLQAWADYLANLEAGTDVIPLPGEVIA